ncbi:PAS domain S-box protein [Chroococcidiopsis sp. FACHB-1243]|uniref:PAS domain-containing sensor histidine kinase n=1 Tax=Chroococcidiopsis sp. [FACHB-1243] TaxID=2692781 RepID=UPI00177F4ABB|nr:PAS domain S-box protein [Chroococcidiopsis sp. [FACHB-1243]]MBD2308119.1 PAS domain S-box protein [Chroococcidiopsis sp. [FACHB-1243]]
MTSDKIRNGIVSRLGLALLYLLTLLCLGWVSFYSLTEWRVTVDRQVNLQMEVAATTPSTTPESFQQQLLQQTAREAKKRADNAIAVSLVSFGFSAIGFLLVYYLLNLQLQRELAERQRAEEALRQAETKYRSIFENAIEGIFQTTPDGRYLTANPMLAKIYGYSSPAELMANISDLGQQLYVNPNRRTEFIRLLQQHDTVAGFESQVYRQDGQAIWIAEQARIVRDDKGKPLYYEGIVEDITERKHAEEERAKLIAILEATLDFVATADLDERVHYLNSSACKVFGCDRDRDFTNLHLSNLHPAWAYDLLHREAIPTAIQDGVWVGETAILSHDGREIPVSQLLIAHKSSQGKVKLLSTIARDITQRLQIEASLREAERRWRSLLENVRLVVVGLDRQGIVEYVNPFFLELVEYTSEEVLGKNWYEVFLPPHQRQRVQEHFLQLQQQGLHNYYQNSILTKSGQERLIAWNNTILRDLQDEAIATLSIGEDITERYAIERMKDEFVSVVSHELRTPLTSIHGALNLLSSGLIDAHSDRGRRVIDIASEGADRLVRLVNDILELERLESGKISLLQRSCNAADLLEKATDLMQVMANRAKVTLSVYSQDIQLNVDGDRIIQVLTNLLGNAIKFSPEGSTVELSIEAIEGGENSEFGIRNSELNSASAALLTNILFTVKDRGRGIPEDKIESIFERFHQVDASDSRKKGGTGLGLAICRSIIQQHGGRIWAESVLGEGSRFYFTLPSK